MSLVPPRCAPKNGEICYVYFITKQEKHDRVSQQYADGKVCFCLLFVLFWREMGAKGTPLGVIYTPGKAHSFAVLNRNMES